MIFDAKKSNLGLILRPVFDFTSTLCLGGKMFDVDT